MGMGYQELIAALRQDGEEKIDAIRRGAEAEAERIRSETSVRLGLLREEYAKRQAATIAEETRGIVAEAAVRGGLVRLAAEHALVKRLYALAQRSLKLLRGQDYEALFAALAEEIPAGTWEQVTVNPADEGLARHLYPAAVIVADDAVTGGVAVIGEGGRFRVVNTLEKRLERGWPEIYPDLVREIYRDVSKLEALRGC